MGAPQRQVINLIGEKAESVEERFEGYREELLEVLGEILRIERQRPHKFSQQISRRITVLGELLARKSEPES